MRTTLTINDDVDVLAAAKQLAAKERKSLGEALSVLARRGLTKGTRGAWQVRNGVSLLLEREAVTLEVVNELRDEQS